MITSMTQMAQRLMKGHDSCGGSKTSANPEKLRDPCPSLILTPKMGSWGMRLEEGTGLWDLLYVYPEPRRIEWGGQGGDFILMSGPTSDPNSLCDLGHV